VSRDFYVVLSGEVAVTVDGRVVRTLGAGEFFGELAAIDWGAGFGRTRSATVTATEPTRLLALDWALVNWLMKADRVFSDRLERASRERVGVV
jgi:CRP-like cAMP-binding protein